MMIKGEGLSSLNNDDNEIVQARKNGIDEPICKAEIKTHTQRLN